jgi:hypothetical protein
VILGIVNVSGRRSFDVLAPLFALALSHDPCFSSELFFLPFNEKLQPALSGLYLSPSHVVVKFYSILSPLLSTEQKAALPLSVFLVLPLICIHVLRLHFMSSSCLRHVFCSSSIQFFRSCSLRSKKSLLLYLSSSFCLCLDSLLLFQIMYFD